MGKWVIIYVPTYMYHENQPFMWVNTSVPWILWESTNGKFGGEPVVLRDSNQGAPAMELSR